MRQYLPTLAELIDRLSIVRLKSIFIPEHAEAYRAEIALIMHDVDEILGEKTGWNPDAKTLHAVLMLGISNRFIWENESKARQGWGDQDKLLRLTHSINGVRNTAKNVISQSMGERIDHKVDCFSADLVADYGNWQVFDEKKTPVKGP